MPNGDGHDPILPASEPGHPQESEYMTGFKQEQDFSLNKDQVKADNWPIQELAVVSHNEEVWQQVAIELAQDVWKDMDWQTNLKLLRERIEEKLKK